MTAARQTALLRARSRSIVAAAWLAALPTVGCGLREDVDLDPMPPDASAIAPADAAAASSADAPVVSPADAGADSPSYALPDASPDAPPDAPASSESCTLPTARSCQENGAPCEVTTECCSLRCLDGDCLAPGTCTGPWGACTTRASCCSGRCEPIPDTTFRMCLDYCLPAGAPCDRALDCCSTGCHGGMCAPQVCTAAGGPCAANADCCSGICPPGLGMCVRDSVSILRSARRDVRRERSRPVLRHLRPDVGYLRVQRRPLRRGGHPVRRRHRLLPRDVHPERRRNPGVHGAVLRDGSVVRDVVRLLRRDVAWGCRPCARRSCSACRALGAPCATADDCCSSQCIASLCASECSDP